MTAVVSNPATNIVSKLWVEASVSWEESVLWCKPGVYNRPWGSFFRVNAGFLSRARLKMARSLSTSGSRVLPNSHYDCAKGKRRRARLPGLINRRNASSTTCCSGVFPSPRKISQITRNVAEAVPVRMSIPSGPVTAAIS